MFSILLSIILMLGVMYPFMNILIQAASSGNTFVVGLCGFFMTGMVAFTGASISKMRERQYAALHASRTPQGPRKTVYESVARTGGGVMQQNGKKANTIMANGRMSQSGGTISNARKRANRKNQKLMKQQAKTGAKNQKDNLQDKGNAGVQQQVKFDPMTGQVYLLEKSTGGAKGLITGR